MTHTKIMHWGRSWPRPKNHLDGLAWLALDIARTATP